MIRRRFLGLAAGAGAAGVAALKKTALAAGPCEEVVFQVKGFTCLTCATGLETILGREKGVLAVAATYPEGKATIRYQSRVIDDMTLQKAIEDMGFQAQKIAIQQG